MNILIDMNLTPEWIEVFKQGGWEAIHWSDCGPANATDRIIMDWAYNNNYIIFTNDLDFGTLLALTKGKGPSVIQIRAQDILPKSCKHLIFEVLNKYSSYLEKGALISLDEIKARVRILPI